MLVFIDLVLITGRELLDPQTVTIDIIETEVGAQLTLGLSFLFYDFYLKCLLRVSTNGSGYNLTRYKGLSSLDSRHPLQTHNADFTFL